MAPTRRNIQKEETVTSGEFKNDNSDQSEVPHTAPEVPSPVIFNFFVFTFAMVTFPIISYFLSLRTIFNGNSTYSAALAVLVANLVLAGFVIQALREDQADNHEGKKEGKKER